MNDALFALGSIVILLAGLALYIGSIMWWRKRIDK